MLPTQKKRSVLFLAELRIFENLAASIETTVTILQIQIANEIEIADDSEELCPTPIESI